MATSLTSELSSTGTDQIPENRFRPTAKRFSPMGNEFTSCYLCGRSSRRQPGSQPAQLLGEGVRDVVALHSPFPVHCSLFTSLRARTIRLTLMRACLPHHQERL